MYISDTPKESLCTILEIMSKNGDLISIQGIDNRSYFGQVQVISRKRNATINLFPFDPRKP